LIQFIDISLNELTGSVPSCVSELTNLRSLNLSHNFLSESIDDLFTATNSSIQSVDLSDNRLSGPLPATLFSQPSLQTVLLFDNCFSGSIPSSICKNSNIQSLFLDSLTSNCDRKLLFGVSVPNRLMVGSIPSCIWRLRSLTLLHMAGNGIGGSLSEIPTDSKLSVLVLASNALTGPIPESMQTSPHLTQLDLSANRLSGVLNDAFNATARTVLDLTVNRLSGQLPASFSKVMHDINVLDGNLFDCEAGNLPQQDPSYNSYVCGANDLNQSLQASVGLFGAVLVTVSVVLLRERWMKIATDHVSALLTKIRQFIFVILIAAGFIATLGTVLYCCFKSSPSWKAFNTHTEQYTWIASVAFLHGWLPAFVTCILTFICAACCTRFESVVTEQKKTPCTPASKLLALCLLHAMNVIVVIAVNGSYVDAVLQGVSESRLFALQILLAAFKVSWSAVVIPSVLATISISTNQSFHRILMSLFAFIGGPFISTFFTASDCFRDLFVGEIPVTSTASLLGYTCRDECTTSCFATCTTSCVEICGFYSPEMLSLTMTPPWIYSYQCSSSLVVDYVPVIIVTYAISGAVVPLVKLALFMFPSRYLSKLRALFPAKVATLLFNTMHVWDRDDVLRLADNNIHNDEDALIKVNNIRVKYLLNVAVLLTFGIASPLLAVVVGLETVVWGVMHYLAIGRLLDTVGDDEYCSHVWSVFDREAVTIRSGEMLIVLLFTSVFWCLFVFDMVGDVYGALAGGLSVLAPICVPFLAGIIGSKLWAAIEASKVRKAVTGLEMGTMPGILTDPQTANERFTNDDVMMTI
jgi:hypothetical protein